MPTTKFKKAIFLTIAIIATSIATTACGADNANKNQTLSAVQEKTTEASNQSISSGDKQVNTPIVTDTVVIKTSMGDITVELYGEAAPLSVKNFLQYVNDDFYDQTIFHRVINNFMIQGGGFTEDYAQKSTRQPIKNEAANGLKNSIGTIAMARTGVIDSATSQFFINIAENTFLNHTAPTVRGFGYAVFGKVSAGMDVVNQIKMVGTAPRGPHANAPIEHVIIEDVVVK